MDTAHGYAWHAGELALQRSMGERDALGSPARKVIRAHMPEQHRDFFADLPWVVVGSVDPQGRAWATVRAGGPGFIGSPDPGRLHLLLERDAHDPADAGMEDGAALGMLGIELTSRRRNRVNGRVIRPARQAGTVGFDLAVEQSFGNCPRYITPRGMEWVRPPASLLTDDAVVSTMLDEPARALVAGAERFFVTSFVEPGDSSDGRRQVDVSHRGGRPGFVRIDADGRLIVPDYPGNRFFNTLGNLLLNPRAGLVFLDGATGDLLQMSGEVELRLDPDERAAFEGAERLWRFTPQQVVRRAGALPFRLR